MSQPSRNGGSRDDQPAPMSDAHTPDSNENENDSTNSPRIQIPVVSRPLEPASSNDTSSTTQSIRRDSNHTPPSTVKSHSDDTGKSESDPTKAIKATSNTTNTNSQYPQNSEANAVKPTVAKASNEMLHFSEVCADDESTPSDAYSVFRGFAINMPEFELRVCNKQLLLLLDSLKDLIIKLGASARAIREAQQRAMVMQKITDKLLSALGQAGVDATTAWNEAYKKVKQEMDKISLNTDEYNELQPPDMQAHSWLELVLGALGITFSEQSNLSNSTTMKSKNEVTKLAPCHSVALTQCLKTENPSDTNPKNLDSHGSLENKLSQEEDKRKDLEALRARIRSQFAATSSTNLPGDVCQYISKGRLHGGSGNVTTVIHAVVDPSLKEAFQCFGEFPVQTVKNAAVSHKQKGTANPPKCTDIGVQQEPYVRPLSPLVTHLASVAENDVSKYYKSTPNEQWYRRQRSQSCSSVDTYYGSDQKELTWEIESNAERAYNASMGFPMPEKKMKPSVLVDEGTKAVLSTKIEEPPPTPPPSVTQIPNKDSISGKSQMAGNSAKPPQIPPCSSVWDRKSIIDRRYRGLTLSGLPRNINTARLSEMIRGGPIEKIMIFRGSDVARAVIWFVKASDAHAYYDWASSGPITLAGHQITVMLETAPTLDAATLRHFCHGNPTRAIWVIPDNVHAHTVETICEEMQRSQWLKSNFAYAGNYAIRKTTTPPAFVLTFTVLQTAMEVKQYFVTKGWRTGFSKDVCTGPTSQLLQSRVF
ncbi:hypothetical protein BDD12DRAFT_981041 [Trichophaea hybrida]|nr:hypothetical protein BDD12DRAFT_981041 [Trichophaea hybrida]